MSGAHGPMRMSFAALALAACAVLAVDAAPLTPEEKALLLGAAISAEAATAMGRAGDAAGLERVVALGDPALVRDFDHGMRQANMTQLPPAVEAVVLAHFDDARVGTALRAFTPHYRTRALFDRHYARVQAAVRNDEPSFAQLLNTDAQDIEPQVAKVAAKYASTPQSANAALMFLARRHYEPAAPMLVAGLEASFRGHAPAAYDAVLGALLDYPSPPVWRQASAEVERLHRAGRLDDAAHAEARKRIDPLLADPQASLERMRQSHLLQAYYQRRGAIRPSREEVRALRSKPREYVAAYLRYLEQLESIANASDTAAARVEVAGGYLEVGLAERFALDDANAALAHFQRSAATGYAMGQVALADTYQFALHDPARALAAYRVALEAASKPNPPQPPWPYAASGSPMNEHWKSWLAAEVDFLETGERFHGKVSEAAIEGFFQALTGNAYLMRDALGEVATPFDARAPSRLTLNVTLAEMSRMRDPDALLRYLERNDPSGYWSACLLATVSYYAARGAAGHDEAMRSGVAAFLPGVVETAQGASIVAAADRFMAARGLRVKPEPPKEAR